MNPAADATGPILALPTRILFHHLQSTNFQQCQRIHQVLLPPAKTGIRTQTLNGLFSGSSQTVNQSANHWFKRNHSLKNSF